ncbi:MAG: LapA family protein [Synergistaceae bacterium]|nr:LapA family protein [Synergistaceae bacterium]
MKSFFVSLVLLMLVSAVYVFQNSAIVNVRFLVFNFAFSQGLFEVGIFALGAALMWFFSIFSYFENRASYKEKLAERVAEVRQLESANKILLDTLRQNSIANPLENPELK